jgi:hypothetical protein
MSQQSLRAEKARHEICRNCKRWHGWDEDDYGRCGKFTRRIVMTHMYDTCENFSERKEINNERIGA